MSDLTDVLRERIATPDTRCGPPVDLLGVALRPSDVQKPRQVKRVTWRETLVILGTGEVWR